MPVPLVPVVIAGVASAGALTLALRAKSANDKAAIAQGCDDLRTRLEEASRAGQDPHLQEQLRIEYSACLRRAVANGVPVDPALYLLPCTLVRDYLNAVWADYKQTSYSDPIARDNKRNAILSQGAQMVTCLRGQLDGATTADQVREVMAGAASAAAESLERANCMRTGASGCGRFAVNEESGDVRGWKDLEAIGIPLGLTLADVSVFFHNHPERRPAFFRIAGIAEPPPAFTYTTDRQGRRRPVYDPNAPPDSTYYGGLRLRGEQKLATLAPSRTVQLQRASVGLAGLRSRLGPFTFTDGGASG